MFAGRCFGTNIASIGHTLPGKKSHPIPSQPRHFWVDDVPFPNVGIYIYIYIYMGSCQKNTGFDSRSRFKTGSLHRNESIMYSLWTRLETKGYVNSPDGRWKKKITKHFRYLKWRNPHLYKLYGCKAYVREGKPTPQKKPEIRYSESWKALLILLKLFRWNNKSSKSSKYPKIRFRKPLHFRYLVKLLVKTKFHLQHRQVTCIAPSEHLLQWRNAP